MQEPFYIYYAIKLILKVPSVTFLYVVLRFKPLRQMSINMITINSLVIQNAKHQEPINLRYFSTQYVKYVLIINFSNNLFL